MGNTSSDYKLSLIIVNTNTKDLLSDCLRSVFRYSPSLLYEVFVVDNNSNDGSSEMIRLKYPQVILLQNDSNLGFSKSNNRAMVISRGEYVLLLNSDAEVVDGTLQGLVDFMDSKPDAASCGCTLLNPDGSVQLSYGTFPTTWQYLWQPISLFLSPNSYSYLRKLWSCFFKVPTIIPSPSNGRPRAIDYPSGACLMMRREALDEIGLLDERFFVFFEESDWCLRASQAGWNNYYVPNPFVYHKRHGTFADTKGKMLVIFYDSLYKYLEKHYGSRRAKFTKCLHRNIFRIAPRLLRLSEGATRSSGTVTTRDCPLEVLIRADLWTN